MGSVILGFGGRASALKANSGPDGLAVASCHGDEFHEIERDVFVAAGAQGHPGGFLHKSRPPRIAGALQSRRRQMISGRPRPFIRRPLILLDSPPKTPDQPTPPPPAHNSSPSATASPEAPDQSLLLTFPHSARRSQTPPRAWP